MKITTLCYIEHDGQYLMLHRIKKENDINEGKWIGVGGHAENGESPEECLLREVKEETGLTLTSYRFRALITFISDKQEPELMCLFTADEFSGKLITCNEGDLKWVDKTIVPTLPTWEGDAIFLKLLHICLPVSFPAIINTAIYFRVFEIHAGAENYRYCDFVLNHSVNQNIS